MNTLTIIMIIVLIIETVLLITISILHATVWRNLCNDYANEKHYCNHCKNAFIMNKEERALTHCPECGRPLTLHYENPLYVEDKTENTTPNAETIPFEDFNNKEN